MKAAKPLTLVAVVLGLGGITLYLQNDRGSATAPAVKLAEVKPAAKIDSSGAESPPASVVSISPAPLYKTGLVMVLQERYNFSLNAEEARVIEKAYSSLVHEREQLELSLAEEEKINEHTVVITIPEYFSKGLELYHDFVDALRNDLGGPRSIEVLNATDPWIRASNSGFGAVAQEISIEQRGATYHIVHNRGSLLELKGIPMVSTLRTTSDTSANSLGHYQFLSKYLP